MVRKAGDRILKKFQGTHSYVESREMRTSTIKRKTAETSIVVTLNLEGTGNYKITTPVPFLSHMLELMAKHGLFDLTMKATGDTQVDLHHTIEDIGICLGQALKKALDKKLNIKRYGDITVPMDESLAQVALDISGRPYFQLTFPQFKGKAGAFDLDLVEEFFQAFVNHSGITLHVHVKYGKNYHHMVEAIFKALGRALDQATQIDSRISGVPSTKGVL
jgi:imidazoleglycerol-phosphate dehydratase